MKKIVLLSLIGLVSLAARAQAQIDIRCLNPATGAELEIGDYHPRGSGLPINALAQGNDILKEVLNNQGAQISGDFQIIGNVALSRGVIDFEEQDNGPVRMLGSSSGYVLTVATAKGNAANFVFNAGECQIQAEYSNQRRMI